MTGDKIPADHVEELAGMKNSEIVDELGIASGTVAAHVFAVRAKLRASLGPYDPFADDEEGPLS